MPSVAYVACADSQEIGVGHLDEATGAVEWIERVPVPGAVMPLAIDPGRKFLYAGLRSEPFSVATLAIEQTTGELRLRSTARLPDNMAYLSTDKTGRFLFGASYPGDKISINPIGRDGRVNGRRVRVLATPSHPHSILTDPSNRHVFVPCLGADAIVQYKFSPERGRLTPNTPPAAAAARHAGPRHLVFHPRGAFAYCTNELDATVGAYRFDAAAGTLSPIDAWTVLPPGHEGRAAFAAADLHVTPDGHFLYASERVSNSVAAFAVDAETGMLTPAGTVPTEEKPRGFNIDPSGRYLLAAGQVSNHLTSYAIDPRTGTLTPRHRYPMGANPNWVEILRLG